MKVLFLDIDGVLNSSKYEPYKDKYGFFVFIDETRLPLLKEIVDKTGAKIVLTSTWRDCWNKNYEQCDKDGKYLTTIFSKYDLTIYDTTTYSEKYYTRPKEISVWLANIEENIESYVIVDDDEFDWGYHKDRVVKTNPVNGFGLEEYQVTDAINKLNR